MTKLRPGRCRNAGDDDADMGDTFRQLRSESKARRQIDLVKSTQLLSECGVEFDPKNDGYHLIINHGGAVVDFYPSTGKWIPRSKDKSGRGVLGLLEYLGVETEAGSDDN